MKRIKRMVCWILGIIQVVIRFFRRKNYKCIRVYHSSMPEKVRDWQRREKAALGRPPAFAAIVLNPKERKKAAVRVMNWVKENIEYVSDLKNYGTREHWATTKEILNRRRDDCDGQAMAMWRLLRANGVQDSKIGMVHCDGHLFCCLHETDSDWWVLDNGFLSHRLVKAKDLFPIKRKGRKLVPLWGFNLHSFWVYVAE